MCRLIVNADDLGYTPGVDRAIASLHGAGALSSATAMATGKSLPQVAADLPGTLGLGCHVMLVDGAPVSPPRSISTLTPGGVFRPTLGRFMAALFAGRIRDREMEQEAVAQIRSLQNRGFRLTHMDTHKHTHLFPRVLRPLLRAALQCGVSAIRNPFEPPWAQAVSHEAGLVRRMEVQALSIFRKEFFREVNRAGLRTTAGALGVLATGVLDAEALDRLLGALQKHGDPDACYELVCHPGFHDAALDAARTRLRAERERERTALLKIIPQWTGPGAPHRLVSFADL